MRSAPSQLDMLAARLTNLLTLADVAAATGLDLPSGSDLAAGVTEAVQDTASAKNGGFFGPVASFLEACLKVSGTILPAGPACFAAAH